MTKVLVVLADGFEELEAISPIDLLRRAGASVTVAGLGKKIILSSKNLSVNTEVVLEDTEKNGWDAIVLPGGMPGAKNLAASKEVSERILNTRKEGGFVCAICASPAVVLAPLGILDGISAVCYPGMETEAPNIHFLQNKVISDKKIITARGAGCATEFALKIVAELFGNENAERLAEAIVY